VLWFGPAAVLVIVLAGVVVAARRRKPVVAPPLDAEEQARLDALLRDTT
jgi:cytochrome c-type biogenesis protein CcmH/NrfF